MRLHACVISTTGATSWQHVLRCFVSHCYFEHKDFAGRVIAFLLTWTRVSKAAGVCIWLVKYLEMESGMAQQAGSNPGSVFGL